MKIRIVKRPHGTVDGMALKHYVPGGVYDVSSSLADYLVLQGYAVTEMRHTKRVRFKKRVDRRIKP